MCQTTQKLDLLKGTVSELLKYAKELEVKNTICLDSATKQNEVLKLVRRVDVMIIIGGKSSSNTTKLAELSRKTGTRTHHIEVPGELKRSWLKNAKVIGIAAGASTPDWLIKETIKTIKS